MSDDLRSLLADVAEGRIDPGAAAKLLDDLPAASAAGAAAAGVPSGVGSSAQGGSDDEDSSRPSSPGSSGADDPATPPGNVRLRPPGADETKDGDAVERIVIQSSARPVRVVADHTVDVISAEGPHTVRQEGGTLRIDAGAQGSGAPAPPGSYRFERRGGLSRWLSQASIVGVPLLVRVNPRLRVDMEVMAGSLEVMGLQGPFAFSVTAGSVRATDCSGPFTGAIRAGSAKLEVRPTAGASSIRVESGSVDLRLLPGSDVRIRARTELGEVKVRSADGGGRSWSGSGGDNNTQEVVLGAGTASIDLDAIMGAIKVRTP
jgi:hypothetical protein